MDTDLESVGPGFGCNLPGCMNTFINAKELRWHLWNIHKIAFGNRKPRKRSLFNNPNWRCGNPNCRTPYTSPVNGRGCRANHLRGRRRPESAIVDGRKYSMCLRCVRYAQKHKIFWARPTAHRVNYCKKRKNFHDLHEGRVDLIEDRPELAFLACRCKRMCVLTYVTTTDNGSVSFNDEKLDEILSIHQEALQLKQEKHVLLLPQPTRRPLRGLGGGKRRTQNYREHVSTHYNSFPPSFCTHAKRNILSCSERFLRCGPNPIVGTKKKEFRMSPEDLVVYQCCTKLCGKERWSWIRYMREQYLVSSNEEQSKILMRIIRDDGLHSAVCNNFLRNLLGVGNSRIKAARDTYSAWGTTERLPSHKNSERTPWNKTSVAVTDSAWLIVCQHLAPTPSDPTCWKFMHLEVNSLNSLQRKISQETGIAFRTVHDVVKRLMERNGIKRLQKIYSNLQAVPPPPPPYNNEKNNSPIDQTPFVASNATIDRNTHAVPTFGMFAAKPRNVIGIVNEFELFGKFAAQPQDVIPGIVNNNFEA